MEKAKRLLQEHPTMLIGDIAEQFYAGMTIEL